MLTRKEKQALIDKLADKLNEMKSAVFVDYKGLRVFQLKDLRRKLKKEGSQLKAIKKTLLDLALKKAGFDSISVKELNGQIALVLSEKDEVSAAKILDDFSKKNENLKILAAILERKFLNQAQAVELARLPSREQSLTNLVRTINAPLANFVSVISGNLRNLVFVLSQIKK